MKLQSGMIITTLVLVFQATFAAIEKDLNQESTHSIEMSNKEMASISDVNSILNLSKQELENLSKKISPDIVPQLKHWAFNQEKDLSSRWKALILEAKIGGASVAQDIQNAARSSDWYMRSAALTAASYISNNESLSLARKLLKDKALVVRSAAVEVLGFSEFPQDRELLWKVINDPINKRKGQSLWIRPQTLKFLVQQPIRKEIPLLVKILKESDVEMREIALSGLEKVSDFKFGTDEESVEEKRQRWLNWWEVNGRTRTL